MKIGGFVPIPDGNIAPGGNTGIGPTPVMAGMTAPCCVLWRSCSNRPGHPFHPNVKPQKQELAAAA